MATDSLYIYVVAEQATSGTISYNDGSLVINRPFTLTTPGQIYQIAVWWADAELIGYNTGVTFQRFSDNEFVTRKSFHIQSTQDVAVYALNQAVTTSDAALIFPVPALGKEYYVMSYKADGRPSPTDNNYTPSEFCIVATQDSTIVQIYPTAPTIETGLTPRQILLNEGETWLCQSQFNYFNLNYDLSGTRIVATAPIAVFGGHQRATVPVEAKNTAISRDQLFEQLPPLSVWGQSYIITPLPNPSGATPIPGAYDLYRVVASEDGTTLRINGTLLSTLNRGQVFEAPLTAAALLQASKKVLVAILKRTHSDANQRLQNGDPFMMIVPPRAQYLNTYRFTNCQVNSNYFDQYLTVITANTNTAALRLDGNPITTTWNPIPNTCYVYAHIRTTSGAHTLQSPFRVGLYVYGYGSAVSYGYVGGMAFVPDVGDDALTAGPDQSLCVGDSVQLKATGKSIGFRWTRMGSSARFPCDTCGTIWVSPAQSTGYILSGIDSLGCYVIDTVQLYVNQIPEVTVDPDSAMCTDVPVVLRAVGQFQTATWSPPFGLSCTTCNNTVATPGKNMRYYVTVHNGPSPRCTDIDSVDIEYKYGISRAFPKGDTICRGDSVLLRLSYGGNLRWAPTAGLSCTTCDSVWAKPTSTTNYTIYADSADCTSQAQVRVTVVDPPTLSLPASITVCAGESRVLNAVSNASSVQWSPSRYLSTTTGTRVTITADSDVTYTIRASVGSNKCQAVQSLTVHVLPSPTVQLNVVDTTICSQDSVQLRAIVTNADKLEWQPSTGLSCTDCPDPIAKPSTDQLYTLKVSNSGGCDTSIQVQVRVRTIPSLTIATRNFEVCEGEAVQLQATSNQTVRWTQTLGFSCTDCPNPTVRIPSAGRYRSYCTASQGNGCSKIDSIEIVVNPFPMDSITVDNDTLCLTNGKARIQLLGGTPGTSYIWDQTPGLSCYDCVSPEARPTQTSTYRVRMRTDKGCEQERSVTIAVQPCSRKLLAQANNVGVLSACSSRELSVELQNDGEMPLSIDSVWKDSASGAEVFLDSSVVLPLTLEAAEKKSLKIRFIPTSSGAVWINLALRSNGTISGQDTIIYLRINGQAEQYPMDLVLREQTIAAGNTFLLPIELNSTAWSDIGITALDFRLRYKSVWMLYDNQVSMQKAAFDLGWRVSDDGEQRVGDESTVTFHLRGDSSLKSSGMLLTPRFKALLSVDQSFRAIADSIWLPDQQRCVSMRTQSEELVQFGCARNLRPIEAGKYNFELRALDPNPVHQDRLRCTYSLGFDCQAQIRLIDALGRVMHNVINEHQAAGDYAVDADLSHLAAGSYSCELRAGGLVFVKTFVIAR